MQGTPDLGLAEPQTVRREPIARKTAGPVAAQHRLTGEAQELGHLASRQQPVAHDKLLDSALPGV